jgi:hypothetical protein
MHTARFVFLGGLLAALAVGLGAIGALGFWGKK